MTESEDARLVKIRMGYDATGGMEKLTDGNDHETPTEYGFCGIESGLKIVSYDLPTLLVLLETNVDPTLFAKWGWVAA